jgi:hypothetical protein
MTKSAPSNRYCYSRNEIDRVMSFDAQTPSDRLISSVALTQFHNCINEWNEKFRQPSEFLILSHLQMIELHLAPLRRSECLQKKGSESIK